MREADSAAADTSHCGMPDASKPSPSRGGAGPGHRSTLSSQSSRAARTWRTYELEMGSIGSGDTSLRASPWREWAPYMYASVTAASGSCPWIGVSTIGPAALGGGEVEIGSGVGCTGADLREQSVRQTIATITAITTTTAAATHIMMIMVVRLKIPSESGAALPPTGVVVGAVPCGVGTTAGTTAVGTAVGTGGGPAAGLSTPGTAGGSWLKASVTSATMKMDTSGDPAL